MLFTLRKAPVRHFFRYQTAGRIDNAAQLRYTNGTDFSGIRGPQKSPHPRKKVLFWQRKQNSGSWRTAAARSTIFIPASGISCVRPWLPPCGSSRRTAAKRPPCWTVRPRSWNSSSWRRAPSPFSAPGASSCCRSLIPPPIATRTSTSCAGRWKAWRTPWPCWAASSRWNAGSSRPESGPRS